MVELIQGDDVLVRKKTKGGQMKDLEEYSGKYDPNIKYQDFSKAALSRLLNAYSKEIALLSAFWYNAVKESCGEEQAFACEVKVWEDIGAPEINWTREALNIQGTDLNAFAKLVEMGGAFARDVYDSTFDFKSPNHVVFTITKCPSLTYLERHKEKGRIAKLCQILEPASMRAYAAAVNPDIIITPLKLPPREGWDEKGWGGLCCQWELKIEPKT
jgi:hypothetical protein